MKSQVVNRLGVPMSSTESKCCIPSEEELKSMKQAGYKFLMDGKPVTIKKLKDGGFI